MAATGMQHVALNCRDRIAQERFYCEHFGFRRCQVMHLGPGPDEEFVMLRLGEARLELFSGGQQAASSSGGEQAIGFKHMAFEVTGLDEMVASLHSAGIETDDIIDCGGMVKGLRVCFFKDPEGNILELVDGWADEADPPELPDGAAN